MTVARKRYAEVWVLCNERGYPFRIGHTMWEPVADMWPEIEDDAALKAKFREHKTRFGWALCKAIILYQ